MEPFVFIIVVVSAIVVGIDASQLGARPGRIGGFLDMGPVAWFFACLLLWIVALPCYLIARRQLVAAKQYEVWAWQQAGHPYPPHRGPAPGAYPQAYPPPYPPMHGPYVHQPYPSFPLAHPPNYGSPNPSVAPPPGPQAYPPPPPQPPAAYDER